MKKKNKDQREKVRAYIFLISRIVHLRQFLHNLKNIKLHSLELLQHNSTIVPFLFVLYTNSNDRFLNPS